MAAAATVCQASAPPLAAGPSHRRRHRPLAAAATPGLHHEPAAADEPAALPDASRRSALALLAGAAISVGQQAAIPPPAVAAGAKVQRDGGDWSSPGLGTPVDPAQPKFFKTPSGVRVQVLAEGSGPAAAAGDTVLVDYVLRRSNGYFIYGTVEGVSFQPRDVPVGPVALRLGEGSVVAGLEEALLGARPGTKLRALVPPELGYAAAPGAQPQMPTFATQRQLENHRGEPLLFELQLLRVGGVRQG